MPAPLQWTLQALLAVTFAWAAAAKTARWSSWRKGLEPYDLPGVLVTPIALAVPLVEAALVVLLVVGPARIALASTLTLVSLFSLAVLRARAHSGDRVPCGCFGRTDERDYRVVLVRNALLGASAGALLVSGTKDDLISTASPDPTEAVPALLVATGVALLIWMFKHATSLLRRGEQS